MCAYVRGEAEKSLEEAVSGPDEISTGPLSPPPTKLRIVEGSIRSVSYIVASTFASVWLDDRCPTSTSPPPPRPRWTRTHRKNWWTVVRRVTCNDPTILSYLSRWRGERFFFLGRESALRIADRWASTTAESIILIFFASSSMPRR